MCGACRNLHTVAECPHGAVELRSETVSDRNGTLEGKTFSREAVGTLSWFQSLLSDVGSPGESEAPPAVLTFNSAGEERPGMHRVERKPRRGKLCSASTQARSERPGFLFFGTPRVLPPTSEVCGSTQYVPG